MVDYDLPLLGWVHAVACLVAMVAFVPAMLARKGSRRHRVSGKVYALAYVVLSVTSLGIYSQPRFWFPHWLALAGLARRRHDAWDCDARVCSAGSWPT